MAGRTLFKKGTHCTRVFSVTGLSVDAARAMMAEIESLTGQRLTSEHLRRLCVAIVLARHDAARARMTTSVAPADTRRQLEAMLKIPDDVKLMRALEDCDSATRAVVAEAQNMIEVCTEAQAEWVLAAEHDIPGAEVPSMRITRRAVQAALGGMDPKRRGPKKKSWALQLTSTLLEVWSECETREIQEFARRERLSGELPTRTRFAEAVFRAAGQVLAPDRINQLLAEAGTHRPKKRSN